MSDQLNSGATSETTQTWKTIHTIHASIHSNKANMKGLLWRPNDIRGHCGRKVSWHGLRARSHTPALPVPDAMLSNGVFHTYSGSAEIPAAAPTFGNAAGDDLDMPEVGTTAGLSVTMFLNEPFHTQVKSCRWQSPVCYFHSPCLVWISHSRFSKQRVYFQSWLFFFCCENVNII